MAKPLGMIIDPNPIVTASDVWGLVLNNICVNTILASVNDIQSIYKTYDYCVDITMQGQASAGVNDTYNPTTNLFISPPAPPIDWPQNLEYDFDGVITALQQCLVDIGPSGGNLTEEQINASYNSALNDNPGLDQATLTLMQSVYNYVLGGG